MAEIWKQIYGMDIQTADSDQKCSIPESFRVSAAQ